MFSFAFAVYCLTVFLHPSTIYLHKYTQFSVNYLLSVVSHLNILRDSN